MIACATNRKLSFVAGNPLREPDKGSSCQWHRLSLTDHIYSSPSYTPHRPLSVWHCVELHKKPFWPHCSRELEHPKAWAESQPDQKWYPAPAVQIGFHQKHAHDRQQIHIPYATVQLLILQYDCLTERRQQLVSEHHSYSLVHTA